MARLKTRKAELKGAADTGGGIGAWQNPEPTNILIDKLEVVPSVVATGSCTMDAGTTATSATTSSDNLIDGFDINTAFTIADNITEKGTNGKSRQVLAPGKWITFSRASGASAGFVATAHITYHRV